MRTRFGPDAWWRAVLTSSPAPGGFAGGPPGPRARLSARRPVAGLLAVLALLTLVACGDNNDDEADEAAPPAAAQDAGGGSPERIVSLSPTATEMLFAIGAGDQVVAVDDQSDFPAGVPVTDLSGFEPNLEAIADFEPDLVVMSDAPEAISAGLEALEIDLIVNPTAVALDDSYDQIAELGVATGHEDEAADLVAAMRSDIDELAAEVQERDEPLTYYHELTDELFSATSDTFIGEIYALAGLANVADPADADGGGFPKLSAEFLVDADPDLVFLADTECCGQTAETFAARPGFGDLTAVTEGRVIELDDDTASRWGPRVVDFLRSIVDATAAVPAG
ncbi:ABC transporter substrate-binding protein [soil metagenome]